MGRWVKLTDNVKKVVMYIIDAIGKAKGLRNRIG